MPEIEWSLLAQYAAGECTADECLAVERWLAAAPENATQLAAMRAVAVAGERTSSRQDRDRILADVRRKVGASRAGTSVVVEPRRYVQRALRIAAVLAAAASVPVLGYLWLRDRTEPVVASAPASRTFTTPRAAKLSLRLPDGTQAELAPSSTLRLPATYGAHDRTVELIGEAVFTVTHDEQRPFAVRTARFVARDLGTRFVVRAYAEDSTAEVVVAEGVVAVTRESPAARHASDSIVLGRGERMQLAADGRLAVARDVRLDGYFGWTEGRLVFREVRLGDAVTRLARWHDIDIRFATPELARLPFSASFENTEPSSTVLRVIADALNLRVERLGRVYTLYAK